MSLFYVYVLKSLVDDRLYIGLTGNLNNRIRQHNKGKVQSTKNRKPFKLIYFEGCLNKKDAIRRERGLKSGFGRAYLKRRITGL